MHITAKIYGDLFFKTYIDPIKNDIKIVDIGSQDINGSLRESSPDNTTYIGVDFIEGNGVDVVLEDPYKLPFDDASIDIVVCSSCLEHSEFFWLLSLEIFRVLKSSGLFYLNVPSNGLIHRYPVDCWRFYPDAGHAIVNWAKYNNYQPCLLEAFIGDRSMDGNFQSGLWNDFVAVFIKNENHEQHFEKRIIDQVSNITNGYSSKSPSSINETTLNNDIVLIENQHEQINSIANENESLRSQNDLLTAEIKSLITLNEVHSKNNLALKSELESIYKSHSWRITAPLRSLFRRLSKPHK